LKDALKRRRHKVKEIISKISIDFLLSDVPRSVRRTILKHEDEIKKMFHIGSFTDYRLIEQNVLSEFLTNFLPPRERVNADQYSLAIINESQRCYDTLKQLGIYFL